MREVRQDEAGAILITLLIATTLIAGFSGVMLMRGLGGQRATGSGVQASKLLFVAEAGLNYNYVRLSQDPFYGVTDVTNFNWDSAEQSYASPSLTLDSSATQVPQSFQYDIQYLQAGAPVAFADRADPTEDYDQIKVTCISSRARTSRVIAAWYEFDEGSIISGALVSDMTVIDPDISKGARGTAQLGNITMSADTTDQFAIFGDIQVNGKVLYYDGGKGATPDPLTDANASTYLAGFGGSVTQDLQGTEDEIPDFTTIGSDQQLFDFDRYMAAAAM